MSISNGTSVPPIDLPKGTTIFKHQVAGHTFESERNAIGLLKDQRDGSILKPITKAICGSREKEFYEGLSNGDNYYIPKELVPEYRGTVQILIGDKNVDFIKLSDITQGMLEPCIMDIKIGRRTWDPLASIEKRAAEELKYRESKEKLGLSLPGFQLYDVQTGRLKKYGKDYGKKLDEKTFVEAIKLFLNVESGWCRQLLMQLLSQLWSCQKWVRTQKSVCLYSSSLLLAYDARRLRNYFELTKRADNSSLIQFYPNIPLIPEYNGKPTIYENNPSQQNMTESVQSFKKVQRSHSAQNNYDQDLKAIRENYTHMLNNLIGSYSSKNEWAFVKMIDFAHIFPSENGDIDSNYLFGIENLVKIFENFLKECE